MAAATPQVPPTTENGGPRPTNPAGQASGTVPIHQKYVAATDGSLPPVWYLNGDSDEKVREWSKTERSFWLKTYGAARQAQTDQGKYLAKIRNLEVKRQAEHGFKISIKEFQKGTKEMQELWVKFYKEKAALEALNSKISNKRRQDDRSTEIGLVRSHPLLKPVLGDQSGWRVIEDEPYIQLAVADLMGKAYDLQLYRNDYLKAIENDKDKADSENKVLYDHTYEQQITEALDKINKDLGKAMTRGVLRKLEDKTVDELEENPKMLLVHPCAQGEPPLDLDDLDCEPPEDEEFDDEMLEERGMYYKDPNDPVNIEERGSGPDGQTEKPPLPKEVNDLRAELGGKGGPLQRYIFSMINGETLDKQAMQEIEAIGVKVDAFCDNMKVHRRTYAFTWEYIEAFTHMVKLADTGFKNIKSDIKNKKFQDEYTELRQRARWVLENTQMPDNFLDALVPPEAEIAKLVMEQLNAQNNGENMEGVEDNEKPRKPTVVDEDEDETGQQESPKPKAPKTKAPKPKASSRKPKGADAGMTAAPPADSDAQFAETDSTPGFVMEMEGKKKVMKRVCGWRPAGRGGNQILLKRNGTNPDFNDRYIYKLTAARKFGTAREEYISIGGKEMATAGARFLKEGKKMWSKAKIGGVAPVERDPEKDYVNEAVTFILIKFDGEAAVWIARTHLEFRFGAAQVQAQMMQYMVEAGQVRSKRPTLTRKPRRSKSKSKSNTDSDSDSDSISVEDDKDEEEEEEEDDSEE